MDTTRENVEHPQVKAEAHVWVWVVETFWQRGWVPIERQSYWTRKSAVIASKSFAKVGKVRIRKYTLPPCGSEGK